MPLFVTNHIAVENMQKDETEESKNDGKEDLKDEEESGGRDSLGPPTLVAQKEDYDSSATVSIFPDSYLGRTYCGMWVLVYTFW